MVTRKPVGPPVNTSLAPQQTTSSSKPPYPTSPVQQSAKSTASSNSVYSADLTKSPAFDLIDVNKAQRRERRDSDASSHGTWDSDDTLDDEPMEAEVPRPLQIRNSQQDMDAWQNEQSKGGLPESLRVGPPEGHRPNKSTERQKYEEEAQSNPWVEHAVKPPTPSVTPSGRPDSNNPYHQQNGFVADSSQSEWQEVKPPAMPAVPPPPVPVGAPPQPPTMASTGLVELSAMKSPPATKAPSEWLSDEHRPASWETAEILSVPQQGQAPLPPPQQQSESQAANRPISTWWQDAPPAANGPSAISSLPPPYPPDSRPQSEYDPPPGPPPPQQASLIDHPEEAPKPPHGMAPLQTALPTGSASSAAVPQTPGTQLKQQRNQTYQIKHVNWLEAAPGQNSNARQNVRQSPILTQNANGPCPLLALVNALVLSTPSTHDTALIETLRTREQVSLGLLLDAVFDELMSGRRGETANQLPDVGELYSFLLALHTGMNVNPRFVTPTETPRGSLDGHPNAWNSFHPTHRAQRKAGAFEETKEMRLYSTFNIPLIHGWTAPADSPAYEAFVRSAQTFEDAQNIQFLQAELEDKARLEGLPPQEQQALQDIETIKAFLATWPTQLTDFGLQTISESLAPGHFAILFRNDHFSTIYKEPKHGALMTLVTDAGYATHDEIVWESLVDVNGSASEMFSGDFRIVSHNQEVRLNQGNSAGGNDGWETVAGRGQRHGKQISTGAASMASTGPSTGDQKPPLPGPRPNVGMASAAMHHDDALVLPESEAQRKASEQEDHDLALALQLQEEEEDQQRQDEQRRKREQQLSEQFLSNESEGPRPAVPPRRNGGRSGGGPTTGAAASPANRVSSAPSPRPAVNRPADAGDSDAPPTYEQAASDPPYRPAGSTATGTMAQGNPLGAYDALRRQQSPMSPQAPPPNPFQNHSRRRSDANRLGRRTSQMTGPQMPGSYQQGPQGEYVQGAPGVKQAEDRCVVM